MSVTRKLKKEPPALATMDGERASPKTTGRAIALRLKKMKQTLRKAVACFYRSGVVPEDGDDVPVALEEVDGDAHAPPPTATRGEGRSRKEVDDVPAPAPTDDCHSPVKEVDDVPAPDNTADSPGKEVDDVSAQDDSSEDGHDRESDAAPPAVTKEVAYAPPQDDTDDSPGKEVDDVPAQDDSSDDGPDRESDAAPPAVRKEVAYVPPQEETDDIPGTEAGDAPAKDDTDDSPCQEPAAPPPPPPLRMDVASCYVRDHDEDAHFALPDAGIIGVADGVGSYRYKGVDASAFARALMKHAQAEAQLLRAANTTARICPHLLLRTACDATVRSRTPGASTAVILCLDGATLRWINIGDSGFAVLRGGEIVHRSAPQQQHFNCPYQLSARAAARGDAGLIKAKVGAVPVMDGDVVVAGTDGLWDNVSGVLLEWYVRKGAGLGWSPQKMADSIACFASTKNARKVDDITVVVAFIATPNL